MFGVRRRSVARYEHHVAKLDNRAGFIDLFWPGVLIVEQKSAGRDLDKVYGQAGEYFDALPEHERPGHILVSDFQTFELHDLGERDKVRFALEELPGHVEAFGFILGVRRRTFRDQDPADIRAAELVGKLHDALFESGYRGHDLERFLVRVVFCLFADDTGIFERDIFLDFIENRTGEDGSDTGARLIELFQVLDTPERERHVTRDEDLLRFPRVNGSLFDGPLRNNLEKRERPMKKNLVPLLVLLLTGCVSNNYSYLPSVRWDVQLSDKEKENPNLALQHHKDAGICELQWLQSKSATPSIDAISAFTALVGDVTADTGGWLTGAKFFSYLYKRKVALPLDANQYMTACMRSKGHLNDRPAFGL